MVERVQINVRIPADLADRLDAERVTLKKTLGRIPSRSEVVRRAIDEYVASRKPLAKRGK